MATTDWGLAVTLIPASRSAYNSPWGFAGTIMLPDREFSKSKWVYSVQSLMNPHYPIGVFVNGAIKNVPIRTLMPDGILH